MVNSVTVYGKLPSLNEYIDACRKNRYAAAKMKRDAEDQIVFQIAKMKQIKSRVTIRFIWYEETSRRDPDNVAFAKKFILDAMQKIGKLKNDNSRYIAGFADSFVYGKGQGVVIEVIG